MDSLRDRIRRSLAQRGVAATLQMCWSCVLDKVHPAARQRENQRRREDALFDNQFQVDTSGIVRPKPETVIGTNWNFGVSYQAISTETFLQALGFLKIDWSEFTFVDFGSGKGRALLLASKFPFQKIIGVEYCEELNKIARCNIARFPDTARRCSEISVVTSDAITFPIPPGPLVLFFFNPFGEPVMAKVVANVMESLRQSPRRIIVIYDTPWFAGLWEATGCFERFQENPAIFDTTPALTSERVASDLRTSHLGCMLALIGEWFPIY